MAIRDTSDYLNDNIPKGSKIVILNIQSDYPDLSDYIIDELIANTVNDKNFSVVDRQQLDAIRAEQNFQWSGEVDDSAAVDIGKLLGAQTIVSGAIGPLGERHRLRIRALEVQTATVQGQYNRNMTPSPILNDLVKSGGTRTAVAAAPQAAQAGRQTTQPAAPAAQPTAPAQSAAAPVEPSTPVNGTYTFFPRPRVMQGGVDKNLYLDRIVIRSGFFTMYFTGSPRGRGGDGEYGAFWDRGNARLTDLDRPSRSWNHVSQGEDDVTGGWYLTFEGVTARRISLTGINRTPNYVFEEIVIGKPDE
jgi:hypothetical protein